MPIDGYLNTIAGSPNTSTLEPSKLAGTAGIDAGSGKIRYWLAAPLVSSRLSVLAAYSYPLACND